MSFHPSSSVVAAACGRDLYLWDVETEEAPKKCLETTIGFLCCEFCALSTILACSTRTAPKGIGFSHMQRLILARVFAVYFHPNGKWLLTCEVRSLGSGTGGSASPHTPHFCIRLRDRELYVCFVCVFVFVRYVCMHTILRGRVKHMTWLKCVCVCVCVCMNVCMYVCLCVCVCVPKCRCT